MARKKREPVPADAARHIGGLLRGVRKTCGYRAVREAAQAKGCPAALQTIYAYERGGLLPSLPQFLQLIDFYVGADGVSEEARLRAVAAIHAALSSPAYHVPQAQELAARLHPAVDLGRRRTR
ncbi:MAG TPA: hypothetical protein VF097_00105 [Actinomycetota bacterium]